MQKVKVVISGLTAAGKTTHGKLLSSEFGIPFFSASDTLRRLAYDKYKIVERWGARWSPEVDFVRQDQELDNAVDREMMGLALRVEHGIFDACLLPWAAESFEAVNMWIESDEDSRIRKCYVSHVDNAPLTMDEARWVVRNKDQVTRDVLKRTSAQSYRPDERFHVVISNTDLIPKATREDSVRGIRTFQSLVVGCIRYILDPSRPRPTSARIHSLRGTG